MGTYVGTENPTTGAAAPTGQGWWFYGHFSAGEPSYSLGPIPGGAPPPPPSGGGSTGGSTGSTGSTGSSSQFWLSPEKRKPYNYSTMSPEDLAAASGGLWAAGTFGGFTGEGDMAQFMPYDAALEQWGEMAPTTGLDALNYQDILSRYNVNDYDSGYDWWQDGGSSMAGPTKPAYSLDQLFNQQYSGRRGNVNPYGSIEARDLLRSVSAELGLSPDAADYYALQNQRSHLARTGTEYVESDHPLIIADDILRQIFAEAGQNYDGLAPDQRAQYQAAAVDYLERAKNSDEGGMFGSSGGFADLGNFAANTYENVFKSNVDDPRRAVLGINTPLESEVWGKVLNKDFEPNTNMYGGPTDNDYRSAAAQGINTDAISVIQPAIEGAINMYVGGKFSGPNAPAWTQGAAGQTGLAVGRAGFSAANSGGDLRAAIIMALVQQGIDISAPYVNDMIDEALRRFFSEGQASEMGGMLPMSSTPVQTEFDPEGAALRSTPAMTTMGGEGMLPMDVQTGSLPLDSLAGMTSAIEQPQTTNEEPAPEEPVAPAPSSGINYAKILQTVAKLIFGPDSEQSQPTDAPTQDEGESAEDFAAEISEYAVQYLSLDAEEMAVQGLQPGTQKYYEYIMAQADSIVAQVLGDLDVDAADFSDKLRTKTQEELLALQRALFVRGQLGQLMGSGTYTDPATGIEEEVIGEEPFNPSEGAYQRGLARTFSELSGMFGKDALDYLNRFLGRDTDFFGMQESADQRYEQALREQDDENLRRRRGMFSY